MDCFLALLREEKSVAKLCGFRKPGSCLSRHQTQPSYSLIIISPRLSDWVRSWLLPAEQKVLWWLIWDGAICDTNSAGSEDSQQENWFGRSIEKPLKSWPWPVSNRGHFYTNTPYKIYNFKMYTQLDAVLRSIHSNCFLKILIWRYIWYIYILWVCFNALFAGRQHV